MNRKGQNISEYGLILVVVLLAFNAMNVFFKRGIQSVVKAAADDLGKCAEEEFLKVRGESVDYKLLGEAETGLIVKKDGPSRTEKTNETTTVEDREVNTQRNRDAVSHSESVGFSNGTYIQVDAYSFYEKSLIPKDKPAVPGQGVNVPKVEPPASAGGVNQ